MNDAIRMQISAFVDNELPENETELLLRRLSQDKELRKLAASYLVMGRVIRGERSISGVEQLRARITAELDDRPIDEDLDVGVHTEVRRAPRYLRPVAGIAIAATVALGAILALRQTIGVSDFDATDAGRGIAGPPLDVTYTVPDQPDDLLRLYYLSHGETSSEFGANSINARLVNLQLRQNEIDRADAGPETDEADGPEPDASGRRQP